jgi:uncharacterized protein YutE (UPF0331/DUF86 family)
VDQELIGEKLESLRRCVQRIESHCPADLESLRADPDIQDILTLNLTRAVQLCVDIGVHLIGQSELPPPATMGETFDQLAQLNLLDAELAQRLRQAVGFRNIAIHNYEAIDWAIVHTICHHRRKDFHSFARAMAQHLDTE